MVQHAAGPGIPGSVRSGGVNLRVPIPVPQRAPAAALQGARNQQPPPPEASPTRAAERTYRRSSQSP